MQQDIGLIYSLLTAKCIDLSLLIDYSTYPRSDQAGVCLIEGWRMVPQKTWVSENFGRISKSRKRF